MKVLHVIPTLAPQFGGPVKVCEEIAQELDRLNIEVEIYTTCLAYPRGKQAVPTDHAVIINGISVRYFPVQFQPMAFSLQMAFNLRQGIKDFDIVHVHGIYRFPQAFAAWCAKREGVPYIITTHGTLDPFLFHHPRHRVLKRIYERLFALPNLNNASAIHFTTIEEQKLVSHLQLKAPGVVIPIGIDWHKFEDLPSPGKFRKRFGLKNNEQIILHLGRINFKKGMDLLVKGFSIVADTLPNAKLVIAGPDNDGYGRKVRRWIVEENLQDRVYFPGMIEGEQVLEAYVDADIFVLPSYTESFGIAVVEAMACECPVIISDKVNIWREVQQGAGGLVVPCDAELLGNAMLQLLENPHHRQTMGILGRDFVKSYYTWDKIGYKLVDMYQALIQQGSGQ